jgi:cytochrome c-type biogenesis protein CcmH
MARTEKAARWRVAIWPLLAVVLVAALAFGATSHTSKPLTDTQRAAALDNELRCPSCEDLSVADSSAASAVAIRQLVLTDMQHGQSQASIIAYLQSVYPGIQLRPPVSGVEGLVWFLPLLAFLVAGGFVGAMFYRRHKTKTPSAPADDDRRIVADALRSSATRVGS